MIRTLALLSILAAPASALAQASPAPTSDVAEEAVATSPFEMVPFRPAPSQAAFTAPSSRALIDRPTRPDLPMTFDALQYDAALKRGAREADMMEGPLNGQWRLIAASGQPLYAFQLTSSLSKGEPPAGAWRNLRAARSASSAGFIALIGQNGAQLDLTFIERNPQDLVKVSLGLDATGRYAGSLTKDGVTTPVVLQREP